MRSMRLVMVLATWSLTTVLTGADTPPYQRILKDADAKKAAELQKRIDDFWLAAKFAQAEQPAEELLALRRQVQGEDQWETADARRQLETVKKVAGVPAAQQRNLAEFAVWMNQINELNQKGRYREVEPLVRRALAICENVLGPESQYTASTLNHLAANLRNQGRYADAEAMNRRALAVFEKVLGPQHPDTAISVNDLALVLDYQQQFSDAEKLYRRALAVYEKVRGPEHSDTVISYNNLALNLLSQKLSGEAEVLVRHVLAIREKVLGSEHPDTLISYGSLASCLYSQGKHHDAEALFQRVLAISAKTLGAEHPFTIASHNNFASVLNEVGRYAEAEHLLRRALSISATLRPHHIHTAFTYTNLANSLLFQGRYAEAESLYRQSLAIEEKVFGAGHPHRGYFALGASLSAQGRHGEAELVLRRAMQVYEKVLGSEHPTTAQSYYNLAYELDAQRRHAPAELLYRRALAIREKTLGPEHPDTAATYNNLANNLDIQGKFAGAQALWLQAVAAFEAGRLRVAASGFGRATAARIQPHFGLAVTLACREMPGQAWQAAEAGLARGLLDDLTAAALTPRSPPEEQRRRQRAARLDQLDKLLLPLLTKTSLAAGEQKNLSAWSTERKTFQAHLARDAAEEAGRLVLPLEKIQTRLPADAALVFWVNWKPPAQPAQPRDWHWGCVVRASGSPIWVRQAGSGPDKAWTDRDDPAQGHLRQSLAERSPGWEALASQLAAQRLAPLEPHLAGIRRLFVVPAGPMAGVPVEVLTDRFAISYVPSGTILARLVEKHRPLQPSSLLALGNPVFTDLRTNPPPEPPDQGLLIVQVIPGSNAAQTGLHANDVLLSYGDKPLNTIADLQLHTEGPPVPITFWRDGVKSKHRVGPGKLGVVFHKQSAPVALREQRDFDQLMAMTRGGGPVPKPLPGTRREVLALASLFPKEHTLPLLGSQASEQELDSLAAVGKLADFRLLHFATHGEIKEQSPLQSALELARDNLPDEVEQVKQGKKPYNGRLTVAEIAKWKLDADLVTLSACETALGKYSGGEGFLGFSQALFQAGARSIVLSRWKVDDAATALFMVRFYENLLGKRKDLKAPLGRAAALREAQHWLRTLSRTEVEALSTDLAKGELRASFGKLAPLRPPEDKSAKVDQPYAHAYYWSAFMLIGDPD